MKALLLTLVFLCGPPFQLAQVVGPDLENYHSRIEKGEADAIRSELPALLSKYPNNPGVLYLQGVLTTDGTEAVRVYQSIVDNFPNSEWADDALYKVYQFYYAIGLYRTAEIKHNQLKTDYPKSKFVTGVAQTNTKNLQDEQEPPDPSTGVSEAVTPLSTTKTPIANDRASTRAQEIVRGQYALQVGAYSQQVNAEKQKLFFEDLNHPVEVINKVKDGRSLFVVLVGDYGSADEARAKGTEFRNKYNINSMVVTR